MARGNKAEDKQWRQTVRKTLKELPEDYAARANRLAELRDIFLEELAVALAPTLNATLRAMPSESYADKQQLAKWINHELSKLNLGIKCPHTGAAAIIVADMPGSPDGNNRFRLHYRDEAGTLHKTLSAPRLFDLELMPRASARDSGQSRGKA